MEIKLPPLNGKNEKIEGKHSVVLIGANGSGKTRMSLWIEEHNQSCNCHRISAQKSLNMPTVTSPSDEKKSREKLLYGSADDNIEWLRTQGKKRIRWGNQPAIHMLDDYSSLMEYLVTDDYMKSLEYRKEHKQGKASFDNTTNLEKIIRIWEDVIPHKRLEIAAGKIETVSIDCPDEVYNGAEMSDGERAVFYFIGEIVSALPNSLIIVDEPENHLHKSILERLWDAIESIRDDCTFLYITHDLNFAVSRSNAQLIWVKGMPHNAVWEYEIISKDDTAVDTLKLEILGNRQKVLLVEGTTEKSIDRKLYSLIFKEYNVISVESCSRVIEFTKAYKQLNGLHYVEVKGIIDRDRRSDDEIQKLKQSFVYCPEVAEIENLFLLPGVIRIVAREQAKEDEYEKILEDVEGKVIEFLKRHIEDQALLFLQQSTANVVSDIINKKVETLEEYKNNVNGILKVEFDKMYEEIKQELRTIIEKRDYLSALRTINNKGLIPESGLTGKFGWKKDFYLDYVLRLLNRQDQISEELANEFRKFVVIA